MFGFSYEFELSDSEVAELKLEDPNDLLVMATMSVNKDAPLDNDLPPAANIYANISMPILINTRARIGMQKLLADKKAKVRYSTELIM